MKLSARFIAALSLSLPALAAPGFTLDDILAAPFPSELVAAPKGDAVAWIEDAAGVRNVRVARAPAFRPVSVTQFTGDDGQEISELTSKPDGSALFFVRGTGPNSRGEFANPKSNPDGGQQSVWMVPLSGEPAELASGHSPVVSPDGATLAWITNGQVWMMPLSASGITAQLHTRGAAAELAWSPDGTHLAFTSDRRDHAFIGVYDTRGKEIRYLDASGDTDQSPVWSPDGRQIAFIRVPATREMAGWGQAPKPVGQPWSIRLADADSGKGHEIWRAQEGPGSVFWPMKAPRQLLWAAGDRILFPWEHAGWLHLYALPAAGGRAVLLTPGDFEIEHVTLAPGGNTAIFSSNQDDPDRRHLWSVNVNGGTPRRLTPGSGIEWSPAPLADGRIALLHSDAKTPARAALLEDRATLRDLAPEAIPANFPAAAMVEPQSVVVPAADGLRLHGQLFLPSNAGTGKHPAVVFFHGGPRRQMLLGWHYMSYYQQAYAFNQYLASQGYIVLSVNYRSGIGYGTKFRETLHYGATGAIEFADIAGAGQYIRARADVDPARVGLWGGSYGGYLTALGLARASSTFAAGVDIAGIHDWNLEISNPDKRPELTRVAFESSPLAYVKTWRSPVLLIQGDDDRNVAFANHPQMLEALRRQGVHAEQLIFADEVHEFLLHANWVAAYQAAAEFLGRYLKP